MPINPFQRTANYFNNKTKINSADVDSQFNDIVNFIDGNILTVIYDLINDQFTGDVNPALQNAFLLNTGDGTTNWGFITIDCFQYLGLSLIKIENPPDNSILASNGDGNYSYVIPTANNQVLRSVLNNTPIFGQIVGNCFEDRSVLGAHIVAGSLGINNIDNNLLNIANNSIPAIKFTNNCVTINNLENVDAILNPLGGIQFTALSINVQAVFPDMITSNMIPDNYFNNFFDVIFGGVNAYNPLTMAEYNRIMPLHGMILPTSKLAIVTPDLIAGYNLNNVGLGSIDGNRLHFLNTTTGLYYPNDNDLIGDGQIQPQHLTPQLRALLDL